MACIVSDACYDLPGGGGTSYRGGQESGGLRLVMIGLIPRMQSFAEELILTDTWTWCKDDIRTHSRSIVISCDSNKAI